MNLKNKAMIAKSKLIALLLVVVLVTAVLASAFTYIVLSNHPDTNLSLDVEIQPRDAKLVVGQTRKFWVIVLNGTSPYDAEWYSNGTFIGSGLTIDFSFEKPCAYVTLSIFVEDSRGNVGYDETRVYDPTYLTGGSFTEDYSYLISYKNSTHIQMKNGTTGTVDIESTNASYVFQNCIDAIDASSIKAGTIQFKKGIYDFRYNITYHTLNQLIIEGEGSWTGINVLTQARGTTLLFNQSNFQDDGDLIWNNGFAKLFIKHLCMVFYGGATSSGHGFWYGEVTFPALTDVQIVVKGAYPTNRDILIGRGQGASGTVHWEDVRIRDEVTTNSIRVMRVNFDSFDWHSGMVQFSIGASVTGHMMCRIEATVSSKISYVSSWSNLHMSSPVTWFFLAPIDVGYEKAYVFESVYMYGRTNGSDTTYHFQRDGSGTVVVELRNVEPYYTEGFKTDGNVAVLKSTVSFSAISNGTYVDVRERGLKLAGTPQVVIPSALNATVWYGATNSTHVQIYGNNATLTGSVYCEYKP